MTNNTNTLSQKIVPQLNHQRLHIQMFWVQYFFYSVEQNGEVVQCGLLFNELLDHTVHVHAE